MLSERRPTQLRGGAPLRPSSTIPARFRRPSWQLRRSRLRAPRSSAAGANRRPWTSKGGPSTEPAPAPAAAGDDGSEGRCRSTRGCCEGSRRSGVRPGRPDRLDRGAPAGEWIYLRLTAVDRQPYVRDNERILNSLPVFPARELARRSAGYHAENGVLGAFDRTIGYDTGVDYAIPKGTRRAQVIRFYVDHMRGWKLGDANYRDGIVDFTRGKGVRGRRRLGGGNDGLGPTLEGRSQRRQARRRAAIDGAVGSCG
jgi:hypothetical protein